MVSEIFMDAYQCNCKFSFIEASGWLAVFCVLADAKTSGGIVLLRSLRLLFHYTFQVKLCGKMAML
jgi:hypothetical protein